MPVKRNRSKHRQTRESNGEINKRHKKNSKQKKATGKMADDTFATKIALDKKNGYKTLPITLLSRFLVSLSLYFR
jgi:hypothetical protein